MVQLRQMTTGPGLVFDTLMDGPADGPLVLLLHGASESFHMWRAHLPALAAGEQAQRSRPHTAFLEPEAGALLLADGAHRLRERWGRSGVPAAAIEEHLSVIGDPAAMEGMLAWYRARGALRAPLGPIRVP